MANLAFLLSMQNIKWFYFHYKLIPWQYLIKKLNWLLLAVGTKVAQLLKLLFFLFGWPVQLLYTTHTHQLDFVNCVVLSCLCESGCACVLPGFQCRLVSIAPPKLTNAWCYSFEFSWKLDLHKFGRLSRMVMNEWSQAPADTHFANMSTPPTALTVCVWHMYPADSLWTRVDEDALATLVLG